MKKVDLRLGVMLTLMLACGMSVFAQKTKTVTKLFLDSTSSGVSYSYDEHGYNTESTYPTDRTYYFTYNDKGQMIEMVSRGTYRPSQKIEYTYNEEGYLVEEIDTRDPCPGSNKKECTLTNFQKYTYTYDNKGNRTETILSAWTINNIFNPNKKWEYTYDTTGNIIESIRYGRITLDPVVIDWKNSEKYTSYTHDSIGNVIEMSRYTWTTTNEWKYSSTTQYEYTYLHQTERIIPNFLEDGDYNYKGIVNEVKTSIGKTTTTTTYYWSTREVEVDDDEDEDDVGIVETVQDAGFKVYPNPTKKELCVTELQDNTAYSIFSIIGQVIQQGNLRNNIINVEHLASGMYYLRIGGKEVRFVKE